MPYALISPEEYNNGGIRIAQIAFRKFEVSEPLFWKECSTEVTQESWYYDLQNDTFVKSEPLTTVIPSTQPQEESGPPNVID